MLILRIMTKRLFLLFTLFCTLAPKAQDVIDLAGTWQFGTGPQPAFTETITLPGSMLTNGKGDVVTAATEWTGSTYDSSYYFNPHMEKYRRPGNVKYPFFLTPDRHYVGHAWYERTVLVPKSWRSRRVILFLERPHIETTVYVNGQEAGHQMSLSTPHQYDITRLVEWGKENVIRIDVYNGIENVCVGKDSHSVTDQTQGNWNGIIGRMQLLSRPVKGIDRIQVKPDMKSKRLLVNLFSSDIEYPRGDSDWKRMRLRFLIDGQPAECHSFVIAKGMAQAELAADLATWDEFHPVTHELTVIDRRHKYTLRTTFGMRDISIHGRQFYLNGQPIWLRGTVENCCFPLTGYPPTDVASWKSIFEKCKEYGLNHMRFHSYCPPEAAFEAADQVGFYLQPEGPSWPNHGVRLRRGQSIDQYLQEECERIVDTYGNHPSFVMLAAGNEPAGDWVAWCNDFVRRMQTYDPSRVYCGASVGGGWAWDDGSEYHVKGGGRGLDWDKHAPHSDDDYYDQILFPRNYKDTVPNNTPIIAHEQGQWCAFPDFREIDQYTGVYKALNFEIFRDLLAENGMQQQAFKFLHSSRELQDLCYKYEIERNLRTPDYAGFQLLALNDYSGQGTALVGPLNVFWQEKKATRHAPEWPKFCAPIVPLAEFPRLVYEEGDTLDIQVGMYQAWQHALAGNDIKVTYDLKGAEYAVDKDGRHYGTLRLHLNGILSEKAIPVGKTRDYARLRIPLNNILHDGMPQKVRLTISVTGKDGQRVKGYDKDISNNWDFWLYPAGNPSVEAVRDICIADTLDEKVLKVLQSGGKVLLTAAGKVRFGNDVKHHYMPVFWNTSWFKMRPPHTTGSYIQNTHPVFTDFPTDDWQDVNWWELVNGAQVMNLSEFPKDYQPIVQPIDTWHVSRKLGMLVEAQVLGGKLLMTTMDISHDLDRRPAARQLRKSVLRYMQSDKFDPSLHLDVEVIRHLFENEAPPVNMFTKESPDELKPKLK